MIRRSAKKIVSSSRHVGKKVVTTGYPHSTSSSRNGDEQRHFFRSSRGRHSGHEDSRPIGELGIVETTVPNVHFTSCRVEDVTHSPLTKDRMAEQFRSTGKRDPRRWTGNTRSSPAAGWSSKLGRSPDRIGSLFELWGGEGTVRMIEVRMLSTKPKEGDDSIHSSSEEKEPQIKEEAPARPKTIEDFQHEEIVGPTVERDESDTANQLRASLAQLTTFMTNLRTGFVLLGSVQLLEALWSAYYHGVGLILGLSQDLTFAMSFILAYLLRLFGSRVDFFSKIEGRSRIRILTLSLQAHKMLTTFFSRSNFVVRAVAFCSLLALVAEIWNANSSTL